MTTHFRIDAVHLSTLSGDVNYSFPSDLTVLAGQTGVGKTTLLELIKFGLGGNGVLAPVVEEYVTDVLIDLSIGSERLRLARSPRSPNGKASSTVRVTDLITLDRLRDHNVGDREPNLSTLLMDALGVPSNLRAASRTSGSENVGARITFQDIFGFMYVPQYEINRDIAHSKESYREPKRKAVFELLFGLAVPEVFHLRSRLNALNSDVTGAERDYETVTRFLRDSQTATRFDAERAYEEARMNESVALSERERLREEIEPAVDRETQVIRDLLTTAEVSLGDAHAEMLSLRRQLAELEAERRRTEGEMKRLERLRDAGLRLASFEFSVCPRCMQSLSNRVIPPGQCRVCTQSDPVQLDGGTADYEIRQLSEQLGEIRVQIEAYRNQVELIGEAVAEREKLILGLSQKLEERTAARVTPRLQAYADTIDKLSRAKSLQAHYEMVLRQWDRADDLGSIVASLAEDRENVKRGLRDLENRLESRKVEIISEVRAEFDETIRSMGVPSIREVDISDRSYLPILDGKAFSKISLGGGIMTATQVAYWISLLTVALRRRDTLYPSFLMIDSPRLALNTAEQLASNLYSRLVTQAEVSSGRTQFIIADNEIPSNYRKSYPQLEFSYANPTISTVEHPGPASVQPIGRIAD